MTRTPRSGSAGLAGALLIALVLSAPAAAQTETEIQQLRKDIEALRQGQEAIQNELRELRTLLRGARPRAAIDASVSLDGARFRGDRLAAVTLVEFSDYQ